MNGENRSKIHADARTGEISRFEQKVCSFVCSMSKTYDNQVLDLLASTTLKKKNEVGPDNWL